MMDSVVNLDICGPSNSVKDVNYWTTYPADLFIVMKACVQQIFLNHNPRVL